MLPSRQKDQVVTLDENDILETHIVQSQDNGSHMRDRLRGRVESVRERLDSTDVEMELDLGDAIEVRGPLPKPRSPAPRTFFQPATRLENFLAPEDPTQVRPLTLKTPIEPIQPAVLAAHLAMHQRAQPAGSGEGHGGGPSTRTRTNSQITPSPFARTYMTERSIASAAGASRASTTDARNEAPESIAPVALSSYPESAHLESRSGEPSTHLRAGYTFSVGSGSVGSGSVGSGSVGSGSVGSGSVGSGENDPRAAARSADREARALLEARELQAMTQGRTPMMLRAAGLMLVGGIAAAAITAYLLRGDAADSQAAIAPPPPMASIALPKDAVLIGQTAPQQLETRPGARPVVAAQGEDPGLVAGATPASSAVGSTVTGAPDAPPVPTEVKFGEGDTLLVTVPADKVHDAQSGASTASSANPASSAGHRRPARSSKPLPPNALVPDSDLPSMNALPASRGGAPKDPVAEAQLRASMR